MTSTAVSSIKIQYNQLTQLLKKVSHLKGVEQLLTWDELVMMPEQGGDARGEQKQVLSGVLYDFETSPQIGQLLTEIESCPSLENELNEFERSNVHLARRNYDRTIKVPKELVEKSSKMSSDGYHAWVDARKNSEWSKFAPILKEWVTMRKTINQHIDASKDSYDVSLDEFEPGLTCERIDQVFAEIKQSLIPLIQKIEKAKSQGIQVDDSFLTSTSDMFDIKKQEALNRKIAEEIGYNFQAGRIDVSVHPFTISPAPGYDVRITTRYRPTEFLQGVAGTIHESGHAMYEQNLPQEYTNLPVSSALSMGVHESQSLFWERHVGLSKQFFTKYWPEFKATFPHLPDSVSVDDVYRASNSVQPLFIRVESDEVTYPLHVILRYEIERGLFDGSISVDELPTVWNRKMNEYLGITPSKDSEGVLQDVHWSSGSFGYFPTYLLGAAYAAQIAAKLPGFETLLEQNKYAEIRSLLTEKIHKRGSVDLNADKLLEVATGEPLNPKYFIDYLTQKYTEIYKL